MMNENTSEFDQHRLDLVVTQWSLLRLAHQPIDPSSQHARQAMLLKYRNSIRNYVHALLQGKGDADDLAQDVLLRLMKGDFANADPKRGRFRDFLKLAVKNMVRNHWDRQKYRQSTSLGENPGIEPAANSSEQDQAWTDEWRNQVLQSTWVALENFQSENKGCCYYSLLKLKSEQPEIDSTALARELSLITGKDWKSDALRQQLRRARLRFAQLLMEEVAASLDNPSPDQMEEELIALGLFEYVRPFLPEDWHETGVLQE